jgi:hypothetical protein
MAAQAVGKSVEKTEAAVVERKSFKAEERTSILGEISRAGLEAIVI